MSEQNLSNIQVDVPPDLPPSTSHTYTAVLIGILFYSVIKNNLPLLIIACVMAVALLGPSPLKVFLAFIKEIFPKRAKK